MYGLIIENVSEYIKQTYGEEKWEEIRRAAGIDQPSFSTHQVYPETLIPKLIKKAVEILQVNEKEFSEQVGVFFVNFVSQYGYDRVLSVLGRHMRDFLNGLDNLHEYLKFSYPRMRAPSFFCEHESERGLTLHYRSKRRGFVYYTMGQIKQVARHFYNKEMKITLTSEEYHLDMIHVKFQLEFDNRAFSATPMSMTREEKHLPISASVLFEIFPFCLVFGDDMIVRSIGNSLMVIMPDLLGKQITNWFDLVRPLTEFKFKSILNRTNNIFELVTVEPVLSNRTASGRQNQNRQLELLMNDEMDYYEEKNLRLKGQMIYMQHWSKMMYLGTPVMPDLNSLINSGLYINDLSMHDFSRDLMLAGTQQSVELKLALDQEQQKSKKLEESMRKLDEEMRRTDELLYQMIPKQVADRLRKGEDPIATCEMFDSVSILFSDVVTFTEICSRITPMEVVSMLNQMYSIFDGLTERNRVYKVETIGDAYMVVSGAPSKETNHAERVCDMALDMVEAITDLKDPSTHQHLRIRVGVHTGAVVAGIVGLKMPRYCLFGDSVNTASRMESSSEAMKIHISQYTRECLPDVYTVKERGEIQIKGKGTMKTYWLEGREHRMPVPRLTETLSEPPQTPIKQPAEVTTITSTVPITTPANQPILRSVKYSPITFQDVRKSIAGSPLDIHTRELRSNSDIGVSGWDPLRYFGSPIPICEFDGNNGRENLSTADYSPIHSNPSRQSAGAKKLERYRKALANDGSLPSSSNSSSNAVQQNYQGGLIRKQEETNHIASKLNGDTVRIIEINSNVVQSTCISDEDDFHHCDHNDNDDKDDEHCSSPIATPEFGRAMYKYSKKLGGKQNNCNFNHNELPESKSDGEITAKDFMRSCIPNSKSQPNFTNRCHYHGHQHHHHHHHHPAQQQQPNYQEQQHQCCSGFNATHRHKMQHNACSII